MKKFVIFLFLGFVPIFITAQTTKVASIKFSSEDFSFEKEENGYVILSSKHTLYYKSDMLQPSLPYILTYVPLDEGMDYDGYTTSCIESKEKSSITLLSNFLSVCNAEQGNDDVRGVYYPKTTYPKEMVEFTGTHLIGGQNYACFRVSPFRYDAATEELYLNKSLEIKVMEKKLTYAPKENVSIMPRRINPETGYNTIDDFPLRYIIVTNNALKSAFQRLADWKTSKGIKTEVVTVEDIYNQYTGDTPQIKIKKALKSYWETNNRDIEYVLLGGDVSVVPAQMCYVKIIETLPSKSIIYADNTPTDWFYGSLETNDLGWNSNGNNNVGEVEDNVHLANEVAVSRLSVNSYDEAMVVIDRIINYERNPSIDGWEDNILMGGNRYYLPIGGLSDANAFGNQIYNNNISPYWNGSLTRFYDTQNDLSGDSWYAVNPDHLQEQLHHGYSYVHIENHGNEYSFKMPHPHSSSALLYYGTTYADSLKNPKYTMISTGACSTNAFDYNLGDCLGEAFIKNPHSGVVSYIGSSRESYMTVKSSPTSYMIGEMYQNIFTSKWHRIGSSFQAAKNKYIGNCDNYNTVWRWDLFGLNMLGDPEMPLYTSMPQKLEENDLLEYDEGWDEIVILPFKGNSCFESRNDKGQTLYIPDAGGSDLAFEDMDADIEFCFTQPNYLPFMGICGSNVHLQNDTILWDYHVYGKNVMAGKNVTTERETGPFVIEKGKTTIKNLHEVTIKNSFEVKLGAELEIINGF